MNFQYKARDAEGRIISATREAGSREAVIKELRRSGLHPIVVIPAPETDPAGRRVETGYNKSVAPADSQERRPWYLRSWGRIASQEEILLFTRDLVTLVHSGVSLTSGLRDILTQIENTRFREILQAIYFDVNAGSKLSEAFEKHPQVFSELYINSVLAGEQSGRLEEILARLIEAIDFDIETRITITNAVRYPSIVLASLVIAFILVLTFVVPNIANIFTQFNTPLPLPTRLLIALGFFSKKYGFLVIFLSAAFSLFVSAYKQTKPGKFLWDSLKLRLTVFGGLFMKLALSRFAATLRILHASGISLPKGLNITSRVVDNEVIAGAILKAEQGVNAGQTLVDSLKETHLFPPLLLRMIMTGEKTGNLEAMLAEIVHHYEREIKYLTKSMATLIEPMLTVLLGGMVLVFALGVFLPMWNVLKLIRS